MLMSLLVASSIWFSRGQKEGKPKVPGKTQAGGTGNRFRDTKCLDMEHSASMYMTRHCMAVYKHKGNGAFIFPTS